MSIRIEVTGNNLEEIADKLRALAGQLGANRTLPPSIATLEEIDRMIDKAIPALSRDAIEAEQEKPKAKKAAKKAEPEVAEPAPADPTPETSAPTSDTSTTSDEEPATPPASASEPLDFDTEVAPVVIETVQRVGKPAVSALLAEFGAERASEVDPALYGELVEGLKALS